MLACLRDQSGHVGAQSSSEPLQLISVSSGTVVLRQQRMLKPMHSTACAQSTSCMCMASTHGVESAQPLLFNSVMHMPVGPCIKGVYGCRAYMHAEHRVQDAVASCDSTLQCKVLFPCDSACSHPPVFSMPLHPCCMLTPAASPLCSSESLMTGSLTVHRAPMHPLFLDWMWT